MGGIAVFTTGGAAAVKVFLSVRLREYPMHWVLLKSEMNWPKGILVLSREISMKSALYKYRYLLRALLLIAALLNCFLRFWGDARPFFSALMLQLWFGQAVFAYLRGGWISIGPGGLGKDASPVGRASLACVSFVIYLLGFVLEFGQ